MTTKIIYTIYYYTSTERKIYIDEVSTDLSIIISRCEDIGKSNIEELRSRYYTDKVVFKRSEYTGKDCIIPSYIISVDDKETVYIKISEKEITDIDCKELFIFWDYDTEDLLGNYILVSNNKEEIIDFYEEILYYLNDHYEQYKLKGKKISSTCIEYYDEENNLVFITGVETVVRRYRNWLYK